MGVGKSESLYGGKQSSKKERSPHLYLYNPNWYYTLLYSQGLPLKAEVWGVFATVIILNRYLHQDY